MTLSTTFLSSPDTQAKTVFRMYAEVFTGNAITQALLMKTYYVYMMANKYNNVLYIGVTNDLIRRVHEHKNNLIKGFTRKYNCHKLVWFDETDDVASAIAAEKRMKKWKREYKENLINELNPEWRDLSDDLL